jgi:hypothetical protein
MYVIGRYSMTEQAMCQEGDSIFRKSIKEAYPETGLSLKKKLKTTESRSS